MPHRLKMAQAAREYRAGFWLIGAALGAAAFAIVALLISIVISRQNASRTYDLSVQSRQVAQHANALLLGVLESDNGVFAYGVTRQGEYLAAYQRGRAQADAAEEQLILVTRAQPELAKLGDRVADAKQAYFTWGDERVARIESGAPPRRNVVVTGNPNTNRVMRMNELRTAIGELTRAATAAVDGMNAQVLVARSQLNAMTYGLIGLFVLTLGLAVFYFVREAALLRTVVRELNTTNAALETARAEAVSADESKTRFLAMASHDMRQPLHALSLYVSALGRRVQGDEAREILLNMEKAASSLTRMFSGLLDLARIEAGVLKPKMGNVPLSDLFDLLRRELSDDCKRAKVKLRVAPTSAVVRSDPELLESILRNLLTNAIKYAPEGRVLLGCRRIGADIRIEVRDEGEGIPEEKLVLMFGEFVRLDRASAAAKEGLGLGLSIASRIASLLGAHLEVASTPGKGTVFWITLPRADASRAVETAAPTLAVALAGLRLAVTDDEPDSLAATARALADADAAVVTFATAEGYLAARRKGERFDALIADPVLYRQIEAAGANDEPAVIVTGATDPGTLARLQSSGMPWLVKPIAAQALVAAVANIGA